jgi:hypothetical protein
MKIQIPNKQPLQEIKALLNTALEYFGIDDTQTMAMTVFVNVYDKNGELIEFTGEDGKPIEAIRLGSPKPKSKKVKVPVL